MLVGFLGVVGSGHPYIPLDDSLPAGADRGGGRVRRRPADADARADRRNLRAPRSPTTRTFPALMPPARTIRSTSSSPAAARGNPKECRSRPGCLQAFLDWLCGEQRFREGEETFLNQAPFSFDLSVMDLYGSLATGGTLYSITRGEIAQFKALFQALNDFQTSPSGFRRLPSRRCVCWRKRSTPGGCRGCANFCSAAKRSIPARRGNSSTVFPRPKSGIPTARRKPPSPPRACASTANSPAHDGALPVGYPMPPGTIEIHDEQGARATRGRARGDHHRRSQRQHRLHRAAGFDRSRVLHFAGAAGLPHRRRRAFR